MSIWEIILAAFALSMDAFSVAICNGLSAHKANIKQALLTGVFFGGFQAIMPLIGFYIGSQFKGLITPVDHWIIFIILVFIGVKMIKEAKACEISKDPFGIKNIFLLAIATSIDALAVGISFSWLKVNILIAVTVIGFITFALSTLGVKIGSYLGSKFKTYSEIVGGIILILIGVKILLEHLEIFSF